MEIKLKRAWEVNNMAYEKKTWKNGETAITADELNRMEAGIETADTEAQTLKAQMKSVVDYIVEQGIDGIWTWRKWNSGIAECWLTTTHNTTFALEANNFMGGFLYKKVFYFPSDLFIDTPTGDANGQPGNGLGWAEFRSPDNTGVTIYVCGNQSTADVTLYGIHAYGKWK